MRAISLWQPWASAIALGHKRIETRGWSTPYRGPLAIHAALRWTGDQKEFAQIERSLGRMPGRIPRGAIVAVCKLVDVRGSDELALTVGPVEKLYGDYDSGRFGWLLEDIVPLAEPLAWKGKQGFFNVPDELLPAVEFELQP